MIYLVIALYVIISPELGTTYKASVDQFPVRSEAIQKINDLEVRAGNPISGPDAVIKVLSARLDSVAVTPITVPATVIADRPSRAERNARPKNVDDAMGTKLTNAEKAVRIRDHVRGVRFTRKDR